ncbi:hypothetical protein EYB53_025180 [Candidatus Chloroploca sp. M-50]|uniref:Restriction endonuclease n=1 Tax=Candidatus Chloroploca mongolica TaxID=2528176 RepID=A0ABS4DHU6_9CHLR|nr:hypothetical protein [Candidatus Chloroploca mongolica]MBP1469027.1 hypothetical protein [Candidatus Chloroploca mongolica]
MTRAKRLGAVATAALRASSTKIVLIDGEALAQYMLDYDIGVTEVSRYVVKKIDLDYFEEE